MDDKLVDRAIRQALGKRTENPGGVCPDDNLLAAYLDERLPTDEKAGLEAHASNCASCQQVLALALKVGDEPVAVAEKNAATTGRKVLFHFSLPISAVAVVLLAVAAGVLFWRLAKELKISPPITQTAELRAPAKVSEPQPAPASEKAEPPTPRPDIAKPPPSRAKEPLRAAVSASESVVPAREDMDSLAVATAPRQVAPPPASEPSLQRIGPVGGITAPQTAEVQVREAAAAPPEPGKAVAAKSEDRVTQVAAVGAGLRSMSAGTQARTTQAAAAPEPRKKFSLSVTPRDALFNFSDSKDARKEALVKKIGDRSFEMVSGYWIDSQCAKHKDAGIVEVRKGAEEFDQILMTIPELSELLSSGTQIMIYWNEKNCVIRQ